MFFSRSIRDLLKFKEEVTKERDQLLSEVVKLRECLAQTIEQQQETERSREEAEQTLSQVCSEHREKDEETSPSRRSFCPSPVSLPVLFLSLIYPAVPPMKHPWFCLFLWFVFARAVLIWVILLNSLCLRSHQDRALLTFLAQEGVPCDSQDALPLGMVEAVPLAFLLCEEAI